jgi:flavin-dependent dehydrogenase
MDSCDALIVGGGPAGSTCAWKLRQAGLDVRVVDAAVFPRDKVCAGWITPQVVAELALDTEEYRQGRTFQPITGFRVGLINSRDETRTTYGHPVSFGIRRCEFDHYLLRRSGARVTAGMPVTNIRRAGDWWVVNGAIRAPLLIGAGGQFCPVARSINGTARGGVPLIVAQEAEFPIEADDVALSAIEGEVPALYFSRDLKGYGWCVRKGDYLNVGLGRLDRRSLPRATAELVAFLATKGTIAPCAHRHWRGHAYAVYESPHRNVVDAGVMLVGDAAGLAYPQSGEGIRPAIESGLLAAATAVAASGVYSRDRLQSYEQRLRARLGTTSISRALSALVPAHLGALAAARLLEMPAFVRHVVLDRWFLRRREAAL